MSNFEKKFSKYAIPNLSLVLIVCYAIGYLFEIIEAVSGQTGFITNLICLDPYAILHGEVWRIVTWLLIPPSDFSIWIIISLIFYYSIGRTLERTWGDYLYNLYIFSGCIFTILGSFIIFGFLYFAEGVTGEALAEISRAFGNLYFSTFYVSMSIFLAFAMTYPDHTILFMLFIPIKMKYMGLAYGAIILYNMIFLSPYERVAIVMSLLNFLVFFCLSRRKLKGSPVSRVKAAKRRADFRSEVNSVNNSKISRHKCAICGRTEKDDPSLSFRFCSKCNGNYEYCQEHLFTHKHVE